MGPYLNEKLKLKNIENTFHLLFLKDIILSSDILL